MSNTESVKTVYSEEKNRLLPEVLNIIPVASGKGGVGKSTVSANLAVALSKLGAKVGLMDADVYGPSIPILMGADTPPTQRDGKIIPPQSHGIKIISTSFFVPKGEAVIWRGPMLAKMIDQFLGAVDWGKLDYLIVDLPPGTGDIQLSLCQKIPLTGAVIVSTPQDLAFKVAEKAIVMFKKLHTPILGLVENMSGFVCSKCAHEEDIFGKGGAERYGKEHGIPFLGAIPLAANICKTSDQGKPIVESLPDSPAAESFRKIAENLVKLAQSQNQTNTALSELEPVEMTQPSPVEVRLVWKDGRESLYPARFLRLYCSCAQCVDEVTSVRRVREEMIPKDLSVISVKPVGRYGIQFQYSDGHSTGIYTYEYMRSLDSALKGQAGGPSK